MTTIELTDNLLIVHVKGFDKWLSLKSQIKVPLIHVKGVQKGPTLREQPNRARAWTRLGTYLPGVIAAGSFSSFSRGKIECEFWDVHNLQNALVIDLVSEPYTRLVIEVENPNLNITRIEETMQAHTPL